MARGEYWELLKEAYEQASPEDKKLIDEALLTLKGAYEGNPEDIRKVRRFVGIELFRAGRAIQKAIDKAGVELVAYLKEYYESLAPEDQKAVDQFIATVRGALEGNKKDIEKLQEYFA